MYAIIETGGKQYRVVNGDRIQVEKLATEPGQTVQFDKILLLGNKEEKPQIGTPFLKAEVKGKILAHSQGKKIVVYTYKRRKGYEKKHGHRQDLTTVEITEIKS